MQTRAWVTLAVTVAVTVGLLLVPRRGDGVPFTPGDDEVLEQVGPTPGRDGGLDPDEAATFAQTLLERSRKRGGDPRLLGQAQAALAPWWTQAEPPARVRLMRATILQSLHDFDGALRDLDALASDATNVQAHLTRAVVLNVRARYDEALESCTRLEGQVEPVIVLLCRAPMQAVRGKAVETAGQLRRALEAVPAKSLPGLWGRSLLGEVLLFSGQLEASRAVLEETVALDPSDSYSRLLLAEVLRLEGRSAEVQRLFEGRELNDAELLQWVLSGSATTAAKEALQERVEAQRRRGDVVHRREEARYALEVESDPETALALASANWGVQREPADALVLLEAALAAKRPAEAAPVVEWLRATGFEDPRHRRLASQLEASK